MFNKIITKKLVLSTLIFSSLVILNIKTLSASDLYGEIDGVTGILTGVAPAISLLSFVACGLMLMLPIQRFREGAKEAVVYVFAGMVLVSAAQSLVDMML